MLMIADCTDATRRQRRLRATPLRHRLWLAAITPLLALAGCGDDADVVTAPAPWSGERTFAVGGTTIQARLDRPAGGSTGPTIILMSGLDTPLEVWAAVRTPLAQQRPVFSYDRGGVGRSGPAGSPRTSQAIAQELHAVLGAARLEPPYLVVAHSIAGLHARVFADRYRNEIAGLVLVDATPEGLLDLFGPEEVEAIASSQQFPGARAEVQAQATSVAQVRAGQLPDVPLLVLTSMAPVPGEGPAVRDWLAEMQGAWLSQVTRGEQRRLAVGHMIPLEAPEAIVDAVGRTLALRTSNTIR